MVILRGSAFEVLEILVTDDFLLYENSGCIQAIGLSSANSNTKEGIPGLRAVATAMSPVSRTSCIRCYKDRHILIYRLFLQKLTPEGRIKIHMPRTHVHQSVLCVLGLC